MNFSRYSRSVLYVLAGLLLVVALLIWNDRAARARQSRLLQESDAQRMEQRTKRAVSLLNRAFKAENETTYSALSRVVAAWGDQKIENHAQVTHAPDRRLIVYVDGPYKGLQCGYSEHMLWRQCHDTKRMVPYANLQNKPETMSARRLALLLNNYHADWLGSDRMDGRSVEIVQVRPAREIEGARGPARRLWIDTATGLPLQVESFDHRMRLVMLSSLTKVNYQPRITAATFTPSAQILKIARTEPWVARDMGDNSAEVQRMAGVSPLQPKYLPPGFEFDSMGVHLLRPNNASSPVYKGLPPSYAALSRYTDGLNMLSLYAISNSALPAGAAEVEQCDFGPGTLVMRKTNDLHLIAVADLPAAVLKRVLGEPAPGR